MGHVARKVEMRNRDLVGKYEGKRPLGKLGCRWRVNGMCIHKYMLLPWLYCEVQGVQKSLDV
jgi:hypothetical protein